MRGPSLCGVSGDNSDVVYDLNGDEIVYDELSAQKILEVLLEPLFKGHCGLNVLIIL